VLGPLMQNLAVTPDVDRQIAVMRQTLLSRPNLEELVRDAGLDLEFDPAMSDAAFTRFIEGLQRRIRVSARNNNLFDVSYEHADPQTAYRVVDEILQIFIEQNTGSSQRDVEGARAFIDRRLADYEEQLREAELKVAEFRRDHAAELGGIQRVERELSNAERQLEQLRTERESAIWQRDQLQLRLSETPPTVSEQQLATGPSPAEQRLRELQQELDSLQLVFTDRHPDVVALRALIAEAERDVAQQRSARGSVERPNPVHRQLSEELRLVDARLAELDRQIDRAEDKVEELSVRVADTPEVEAELVRLTRDYEIMRERYRALVDRRESAELGQRLETETSRIEFRMVEPPLVPATPSGPPYGLMMLGVVVVGFGAGGGLAFLRVQLDPRVMSVNQLREHFDMPVLGAVSMMHGSLGRTRQMFQYGAVVVTVVALLGVAAGLFHVYSRPLPPDLATMARTFVEARGFDLGQRL
jgi:polysaccharide chain length determinant protein (PEP-CTERM system associated)